MGVILSPSASRQPLDLGLYVVAGILVVDSDPRWAGIAADLMNELWSAWPSAWVRLEHIGSTSVPGLPAKPVIDLMASTADLDRVVALHHEAALRRPQTTPRPRDRRPTRVHPGEDGVDPGTRRPGPSSARAATGL